MQLREYQSRDVERIRESFRNGRKAPIYQLPTGGGKGVILTFIAKGSSEKGNRVWILTHRQELIRQIEGHLKNQEVRYCVIAPKRKFDPLAPVCIASVQTLIRRLGKYPAPDLIVADEAHHLPSHSWSSIIKHYADARLLGVSATPCRMSGKGLGLFFDELICGPSMAWLIEQGFLAKPRYFCPPGGVDTKNLHVVAGDFNKHEAEALMDRPTITGNAVEHYTRLAAGKPGLVFCTSLAHAEKVTKEFQNAGYRAEMIDGKMDDETRIARTSGLVNKTLHLLVSCEVLNEGYDCPGVEVAILLRPTASLGLYLQQIGRALRPSPGKQHALIFDHVSNCLRHGLAEQEREWTLDEGAGTRRKAKEDEAISLKTCPKCYAVAMPAPKCFACGFIFPIEGRKVKEVDGQLVELTSSPGRTPEQIASAGRRQEVGMAKDRQKLEQIARDRGYKPAWVEYVLQSRAKTHTKNEISEFVPIRTMMGMETNVGRPLKLALPEPVGVSSESELPFP